MPVTFPLAYAFAAAHWAIPAEAAIALPPKVVARPLELRDYRAGIGLAYTDLDNPAERALLGVMEEQCLENEKDVEHMVGK